MREPTPDEKVQWQTAGVAAGLGCSIVATVILCIVGGILLDRWLDTSPWLTFAGIGLALVTAGYQLYELSTMSRPGKEPGVVTRQVARVVAKRPGGQGQG